MARKGIIHRKDRRSLRYQHKREDLTDPDLPLTEKLSSVTYRRKIPKENCNHGQDSPHRRG